jgi:hypothetical protein
MEPIEQKLATFSSNKKHKREVCRYWLQSRCIKGSNCEFIHTVDYTKMPTCAMGDHCPIKNDCPYEHLKEDRMLCANYQLGFCSFGKRCRHQHLMLGPESLKDISPYWTSEYAAIEYASESKKANKHFRKTKCDYFMANGWCPYFDMCNFEH